MAKKQGLGRDINKSLEVMEDLMGPLSAFIDMPAKKGLISNKIDDKDLEKLLDETLVHAFELRGMVEKLKHAIQSAKAQDGSRFRSKDAAQKVVEDFLSEV